MGGGRRRGSWALIGLEEAAPEEAEHDPAQADDFEGGHDQAFASRRFLSLPTLTAISR